MKVVLLTSVVALVAGQPTGFTLPPRPLTSVCAKPGDPSAQCCVDPAPRPWAGGCNGILQRFNNNPQVLNHICCGSSEQCCPTESWGPSDDDKTLALAPKFECCVQGQGCKLDTTTGKGVCEEINTAATDWKTTYAGMTNKWNQAHLDGEGRCAADGSIPLQIRPRVPYRCSLNTLLPYRASCPTDSTCTKDLQANANTGVCCRTTNCQTKTSCTDCVTPMDREAFNALSEADKRTHQPVCSWLTQGDRYNVQPRCVTSCKNFEEKSCIVGGLPGSTNQCPKTNDNVNGTQYNTGTCKSRCGMVGHGRSSRINNNGNVFGGLPGSDENTTPCCIASPGDFCCNPWKGIADHCSPGYVLGGPQCGVPLRGSPQNFFNTAPYSPPPYYGAGNGGIWNRPPVMAYPPMYGAPAYGGYGGMYGAPAFGGMYGNGFGMYGAPGFGGFGNSMYQPSFGMWREGEDAEKQLFMTPNRGFGFGFRPYSPRPAPYYGYGALPEPLDQFPSQTMCSCDDKCNSLYDDCCSDYVEYCAESV